MTKIGQKCWVSQKSWQVFTVMYVKLINPGIFGLAGLSQISPIFSHISPKFEKKIYPKNSSSPDFWANFAYFFAKFRQKNAAKYG